jgi:hypothetical protein
VLPSGPKLSLGLLATVNLEVVPFCPYAPFPVLLPFLKCILEDVFCEGVQHCLQFASIISFVSKWQSFSFIFNWGNRKLGWVGNDSHVDFGKKIPWPKQVSDGVLS